MKKFSNKIILQILERYQPIWSLNYWQYLGDWDTETNIPRFGTVSRSFASKNLSVMLKNLYTDKQFRELVSRAENEKNLNEFEQNMLRVLKQNININLKLPEAHLREFAEVAATASVHWHNAKKNNDFKIFKPYLKKIIDLTKERTELLGYKDHPYDALIDFYEPGWTKKDLDKFFTELMKVLEGFKQKTNYNEKIEKLLAKETTDITKQKQLTNKLLDFIGMNNDSMRIDESAHPFSLFLGKNDVRITTNYSARDFTVPVLSTLHEFGHAVYSHQVDSELEFSPLWPETSYGLHESHSRFWENMICRNKEFLTNFVSDFKTLSPGFEQFNIDDIYYFFNRVKPNLIRIEADEINYHYHILIRYEIEKMMLEENVNLDDLVDIWNAKYQEYLGVKPRKISEGILQDIHWSLGNIGYFPTYSIGSVTSAIWASRIPDLSKKLSSKSGIRDIVSFMSKNVYRYGGTYTLSDVLKKSFNEEFSIQSFEKYLTDKYEDILT